MNKLLSSISFLFLLCFTFSCYARQVQDFENDSLPNAWFNARIVSDSSAYSGSHYARVDASQQFGPAITQAFSPETPFPGLRFRLKVLLRMQETIKKAFLVLSFLDSNDRQLYWHAFDLHSPDSVPEKWYAVSDSVDIPADILRLSRLRAYFWNPEATVFAIDDLELSHSTFDPPDYLPKSLEVIKPLGQPRVIFQNRYYELLYFNDNHSLILADNRGRQLTEGWSVLTSLNRKKQPHNEQSATWKLRRIRQKDGKTHIRLVNKSKWSVTKMDVISAWDDPLIEYELKTRFKKRAELDQQALVVEFNSPLNEVYRKNRQIDSIHFQKQYYLDNQGFRFGKDEQCISLYHPSKLSSIQLDSYTNQAFLNIDAAFDHPMIHYPLLPDTQDVWIDKSRRQLRKGTVLHSKFKLVVGSEPIFLPRLMPVPLGFEAALAWSEHADWTNIRTQRAVNFGHENITHPDSAIGGFVFYNIPVTKSVFYNNPDRITNTTISDSLFKEQHATIAEDSQFALLLKQLFDQGHEICLHTPEQFTSTRKNLQESLAYMQHHFGSAVWIDHGYNNSKQNNRENWICDGQLRRNRLKTWKNWEKYEVKAFWNPFEEELAPFSGWTFDGQLHQPYPGFGDAFPDKIFHALHNGFDGWLWTTHGTLEVPEEQLWSYYFSNERLMRLVKYRNIHITHVYPAWVQEQKGYWRFDEHNKVTAEDGFNQALARIDSLRNEGLLLPATVGELILYNSQCRELNYKPQTDGSIQITHQGNKPIHGLSFITTHKNISITNKTFQSRPSGSELIFWFDLQPGETVTIQPKYPTF